MLHKAVHFRIKLEVAFAFCLSVQLSFGLDAEQAMLDECLKKLPTAIRQTQSQYSDDGKIVVWTESYIAPKERSVITYVFRYNPDGRVSSVGSRCILNGMYCTAAPGGGWIPRHQVSASELAPVKELIKYTTTDYFAAEHLAFAEKVLGSPDIEKNPSLMAEMFDIKRMLKPEALQRGAKSSFSVGQFTYFADVENGLITEMNIVEEGKIRIQVRNEILGWSGLGNFLKAYTNETGKTIYYDPSDFNKKVFGKKAIGVIWKEGSAGLFVNRIAPGSPADRAGLHVGQLLTKVDGVDVAKIDGDSLKLLMAGDEAIQLEVTDSSGKKDVVILKASSPETW
jgi:hypothetical protein